METRQTSSSCEAFVPSDRKTRFYSFTARGRSKRNHNTNDAIAKMTRLGKLERKPRPVRAQHGAQANEICLMVVTRTAADPRPPPPRLRRE